MTLALDRAVPTTSFMVTSLVALLSITIGWLVGVAPEAGDESPVVSVGASSVELPPGWIVVEESGDGMLATNGVGGTSTMSVFTDDSEFGARNVDQFVALNSNRLVLFYVEESTETEVLFRFVAVDLDGRPNTLMKGKAVFEGPVGVAVFSPESDFAFASESLDFVVESIQ